MKVEKTGLEGLLILEPKVFADSRGLFMESFNGSVLHELGITVSFVQDNQSHSVKNVIRGLHFQKAPFAQTKLVRVIYGTIVDVVVDLRVHEPTFKKVYCLEISAENRKQLLIPKGFAHGFSVLSETAGVLYKCDEYYHPEAEGGLLYNDPSLTVDWKVRSSDALVSSKDLQLPTLPLSTFSF